MVAKALAQFESNDLVKQIEERLPAVLKANRAFGKSNSQTSSSLMSLNMIDAGPYRVIRQILAQIENKRLALKEAGYKHAKAKLRLKEIGERIKQIELSERPELVNERERCYLRVQKIESDLADSKVYIEATVKEIGAFLERYRQVLESHGIREDWDEADFEAAEIAHHITAMFRLGLRDRMGGSVNMGTMEYFEQFGIEPMVGYRMCDEFLQQVSIKISKANEPTIAMRHEFYDRMVERFKDHYKVAIERIGLRSVTYDQWMLKNN
jgi:hypothetical protein